MILDELVDFSVFYGGNEELVLAGGGNTSAKDGDFMYIKGSGTALATITADGFVKMNRKKLAGIFTKKYPESDKEREAMSLEDLYDARAEGQGDKRPSVETTLHSLFRERFVLHLHPWLINAVSCAADGEKICRELFGNDVLWIEPTKPGYTLAKVCCEKMNEYEKKNDKSCDILILANHGIFVSADTADELGEKLGKVMSAIRERLEHEADLDTGEFDGEASVAVFNELNDIFGEDSVITFSPSVEVLEYAKTKENAQKLFFPFNPDQIVYCKPYPVYAESADELGSLISEYKNENGFDPKIILVKGCGLYAVDRSEKGSERAELLFNDAVKIAVGAESFGGIRPMSRELTDFIVNWEAESYRSKKS